MVVAIGALLLMLAGTVCAVAHAIPQGPQTVGACCSSLLPCTSMTPLQYCLHRLRSQCGMNLLLSVLACSALRHDDCGSFLNITGQPAHMTMATREAVDRVV